MSIVSLLDRFSTDEKCRVLLEDLRWPGGVACLRCGDMDVSRIKGRPQWDCPGCGYQFSATAETIMHDTHMSLRKWFAAIYLLCESRKGMSANQLHRTIGVSYKTAWYLCHRIREAMGNNTLSGPTLFGVVEVDETMVGGKIRGKGRKAARANKVYVAGAIQRGGKVRLKRVTNVRRHTLHGFIVETVKDEAEAEAIYTDELKSYLGIDEDTRHKTVNHSAEQWVLGDVRTHQLDRRRVEPLQAVHRWLVPQD